MSKLAHTDDASIQEIEMQRWFDHEASNWHTAAMRSALKDIPLHAESDGTELLFKELQKAGFFYKTTRGKWLLTIPGRKLAERSFGRSLSPTDHEAKR